jgi:asparagine synthase (glutamine-hydrolysing)
MCGIAGFAGWNRSPDETAAILARMCGAIQHRGPDDEGHFVGPRVGLGMRRLSIIDVQGGKQPISNETGDVHVVFNGEIYNHHELRSRLELGGHAFATHSDTETIVHLYEDLGPAFVDPLRGMFGIALWDSKRRQLTLARDRVGIKPLYYWATPDGVAFASELRSFLALDNFPQRIDPNAIARYLSLGYIPDPLCVFEGVRKLPPGHILEWTAERGVRTEQYWSPVRPENTHLDARTATDELKRLLLAEVGSHLESEVPLGAFLSGGVDSSTVVALMTRLMSRRVQTFSIGFEDRRYNEAPDAALVARELGTDHTELILKPDADRLIEDVIRACDEPFADSSALPTLVATSPSRSPAMAATSCSADIRGTRTCRVARSSDPRYCAAPSAPSLAGCRKRRSDAIACSISRDRAAAGIPRPSPHRCVRRKEGLRARIYRQRPTSRICSIRSSRRPASAISRLR